ncbi:MAG: DNA polymerase IV [Candidatus Faecivicinus sp.]
MRTILHSDLNNFYASVECVYDPSLRNHPIAVCGSPDERHGIVLAKNNLAKSMGVRTGEAIWQAREKCPGLQVVAPDFKKYVRFSKMMREIYAEYSDFIEPFGLDEAWIDVTGHPMDGKAIADELRRRAKDELGLTLSVGVSFNKIFAKLGSDMKKPDATTVITPENFREKVWPLPAEDLLYVGPATRRKLHSRNIFTIGQIAQCSPRVLSAMLGKCGEMLWSFANGLESSAVRPMGESAMVKSVGNSTTTPRDLVCDRDAQRVVTVLAESVAERLRANALCGSVIEISVRDCELHSFTRQRRIDQPTALAAEIIPCAMALFREHYHWERPVRSMGVCVSALQAMDGDEQLTMFPDRGRERLYDLESAVEEIRHRFGHRSILRASLISDGIGEINPRDDHVIFPVGWKSASGGG